jgi:hypothetical protein
MLRNERGVAMVTVLFIGAALTVVTSVAAFATIQEFRAGSDDRRAAEALSYAEAGIDRFMNYLRSGLLTYNQLNRSGCEDPVIALPIGTVGNGTFEASITVYNPAAAGADRLPPAACTNRPTSPHPGQDNEKTWFLISSRGRHPDATRVLRQVVALEPIGLPIGVYGHAFNPSAHPKYRTVSVVSETTFQDREKNVFAGLDPYYKMKDFFPGGVSGGPLPTDPVPAAVHAAHGIFLKNSSNPEFTGPVNDGTRNCTANETNPAPNPQTTPPPSASQSLWDSDGSPGAGAISVGCAGQTGYPNSSVFSTTQLQNFARPRLSEEDHQTLKDAAIRYGVYCTFKGSATGAPGTDSCTSGGAPAGGTDYDDYIDDLLDTRPTFIAYFEFRTGAASTNNITNLEEVWACNDNPTLNRSVVVIVRNGGANWGGGGGEKFNGALIVDGNFNTTGNFLFNGTMIVLGTINYGSSASQAQLDACWVKNMPGPFFRVVPGHWSEVDR